MDVEDLAYEVRKEESQEIYDEQCQNNSGNVIYTNQHCNTTERERKKKLIHSIYLAVTVRTHITTFNNITINSRNQRAWGYKEMENEEKVVEEEEEEEHEGEKKEHEGEKMS